jgi:O-antigen ligase
MTTLVLTISLIKSADFSDSINWPKQIALVCIAPLLLIIAIQGTVELTRRSLIHLYLLGSCIAIHFAYFFFEGPLSHQKIWGQLDSSNGAITITSLLLITISFSLVKNKIAQTDMMLLFLFSLGITLSILRLSKLADPINSYGNTNIVSFMFAITFVSGLRFALDKALDVKVKYLSLVGLVIISTSLFSMEDFQGKVLAVLGTLIVLIYALIKKAKLRTFFYFLLLIASISSYAVFSGWVQALASYTQETLQLRMMFWRTSFEMLRENFLFGVGVENYQSSFRNYADQATLETIGNLPSPDNAHNYFLHLLATLGLLGAISIILPFLFAIHILFKERSNEKTVEEFVFRIVFLMIWLDLGISVSNVSIIVLGMTFLGLILGGEITNSTTQVKSGNFFLFLTPILFILAIAQFFFALDSSKLDQEILELEMKPINLDSPSEIDLRIRDLMAIANNTKILKSESVVIALDLEALKAIRLEISDRE